MKNLAKKINLIHWPFFLLAGFLAGFFSLIFSVLIDTVFQDFPFWQNTTLISIGILVLAEELIKLLSISFFVVKKSLINIPNILIALIFGLGFSLFEFFLIALKTIPETPEFSSILSLFSIHTLTSVFLVSAVFYSKKSPWASLFYFFLAFGIHLVYNSFIHIYIF